MYMYSFTVHFKCSHLVYTCNQYICMLYIVIYSVHCTWTLCICNIQSLTVNLSSPEHVNYTRIFHLKAHNMYDNYNIHTTTYMYMYIQKCKMNEWRCRDVHVHVHVYTCSFTCIHVCWGWIQNRQPVYKPSRWVKSSPDGFNQSKQMWLQSHPASWLLNRRCL